MNYDEVKILDLQVVVTLIYICSLIISIYITEVDKETFKNPKGNHPNTKYISIFNRLLVVILTCFFLYISIKNRNYSIKKGKEPNLSNLQVTASMISLISTLIVLYVVIKSSGENYTIISGSSNPNL